MSINMKCQLTTIKCTCDLRVCMREAALPMPCRNSGARSCDAVYEGQCVEPGLCCNGSGTYSFISPELSIYMNSAGSTKESSLCS